MEGMARRVRRAIFKWWVQQKLAFRAKRAAPWGLNWQQRIRFHVGDGSVGVRFPHAGQWKNHALQEILEQGHVRYACLHQIVKATDNHVAFENLRCLRDGFREAVKDVWGGLVQPNLDEDECPPADFPWVENRPDGGDVTFVEKALHPLARSGR